MARFSRLIGVTFAAGPAAVFGAYEKALSAYQPQPPKPDLTTLAHWVMNGNDWGTLGIIALGTISSGYSIYQMFQPDPATPADVKADGRKTREGVEHVSRQVANVRDAQDLTHKLVSGEMDDRVAVAVDAGLLNEAQLQRIYDVIAPRLGAEQAARSTGQIAEAATRTSDEVADLLAAGKFAEAGAAQRALAEAGDAAQAQVWRDTAHILVLTSVKEAVSAYARAVELDPADFWTWIELARLQQAAGSLPEARRAAEAGLQRANDDRERSVAQTELGGIAMVEGDLTSAAAHYQSAIAIDERLASQDKGNSEWQRDLFVSHHKLGDVARASGDLAAARASYAAGLEIADRLAGQDKGNSVWQRDLSVSHDKLGNVAQASGDLAAARASYAAGLEIRERLAAQDAGNSEWQRDLSISHNKLGDVAVAVSDLAAARGHYAADLAIAERLAAQDKGNSEWQRDLYVSHAKLAQLAEAGGDKGGAIGEFAAGEAILVALLARVGDHPGFARDLVQVRGDLARLRGA